MDASVRGSAEASTAPMTDDLALDNAEAGPSSGMSLAQQAAASSLNGADLPHAAPLGHDNVYLSPIKAPMFDIDEFLVSRVPAATLAGISADLGQYNDQLQVELGDVVDRDFRGFVNLGAALKAEGPRIARLDWKVPRKQPEDAGAGDGTTHGRRGNLHTRSDSLDTHYDAGSNLGLERVRRELVSVRDDLRTAEEDILATMSGKEACEKGQEDLKVLLSYDDSLCRLEALLLPEKTIARSAMSGLDDDTSTRLGQGRDYWSLFEEDLGENESESDESSSDLSSDGKTSRYTHTNALADPPSPSFYKHPVSRRRSSPASMRRKRSNSGGKELEAFSDGTKEQQDQEPDLPALIARVRSEYSALTFLEKRAEALGFHDFLTAHSARATDVRNSIRAKLITLITALTSFNGTSLLVGTPINSANKESPHAINHAESSDLERWSHVSDPSEKRSEQSAWLQLAFSTWNALPLEASNPSVGHSSADLEEVIRDALIMPFARQLITPRALEKKEEAAADGPRAKEPLCRIDAEEVARRTQGDGTTLIGLFDSILSFIAHHASEVSRCAEIALELAVSDGTEANTTCDVYVRCVWQGLITELMEQLGGQLFFVGRPLDFQRNYTISMQFLDVVERLAPSQRARDALRADNSYVTFRKRWQLPVYFQMRLRNVVSRLETRLAQSNGELVQIAAGKSNVIAQLPLSTAAQACAEAFVRPWARGHHIAELVARQWRLSLQVAVRYRTFITGQLPGDILSRDKKPAGAGSRTGPAGGSGTSSPARTGTPVGRENGNDEDLTTLCVAFAIDILWLEAQLAKSLDENVVPAMLLDRPSSDDRLESVRQQLKDGLQEALTLQEQVVPLLRARVVNALKVQCAEPLRLVRSLSSQYRTAAGSGGPAKTNSSADGLEPSYFVTQFMRPVRQFLGVTESLSRTRPSSDAQVDQHKSLSSSALSAFLPRQVRQDWLSDVIEDFVARYTASLQTMNKNFESLQRLKRVNATSTASTTAGDDEANAMHAQMRADVDSLAREVQSFSSVDTTIATDTAAWLRLRQAANGSLEEL